MSIVTREIKDKYILVENETGQWCELTKQEYVDSIEGKDNKTLTQKRERILKNRDSQEVNITQYKCCESIYLEITNVCNLKCAYCYNSFSDKNNLYMDKKRFDEFCDKIDKLGTKTVFISGGEPFLHKSLVEFVRTLLNKGVNVVVITNGTIVNKEFINLLKESKRLRIRVSYDSLDEEYNAAMRGDSVKEKCDDLIEIIKSEDVTEKLQIATTIYNQDINEIRALTEYFTDIKVDKIIFTFVQFTGRAATLNKGKEEYILSQLDLLKGLKRDGKVNIECEFLDELFNTIIFGGKRTNYNCSVGRIIKVAIDGEIYMCPYAKKQSGILGDFFKNNEIHIGDSVVQKVNTIQNYYKKDRTCEKCVYKGICGGTCAAKSMRVDTYLRDEMDCAVIKKVIDNIIYDLLKRED